MRCIRALRSSTRALRKRESVRGLQDVGWGDPALREPGLEEQPGHVLAVSPIGLGPTLGTSPGADLGRVAQVRSAAHPLELFDDEPPPGRCLQGEVCIGSFEAGQPRSQGLPGPGGDAATMDLAGHEVLPLVGDLTAMKIQRAYDSHRASTSSGWHEHHAWEEGVPLHAIFFAVETVFLKTLYVLFFIELSTRRVHVAGATARPDSGWVTQQARNLSMTGRLENRNVLVRDRDGKFSGPFDEVFRTEGIVVVRTPVRTPKANAVAERWVGTVRRECLDHVLIFGRRHLQQVLDAYVEHYNRARPHRALELVPPDHRSGHKTSSESAIRRRDILGGLIHEYEKSAA